MPLGKLPFRDQFRDPLGELEEPQIIGDRASVYADPFGEVLVGVAEFIYELLVGNGYFNRIQVFSLKVLEKKAPIIAPTTKNDKRSASMFAMKIILMTFLSTIPFCRSLA